MWSRDRGVRQCKRALFALVPAMNFELRQMKLTATVPIGDADQVTKSFVAPFVGDSADRFHAFLRRCWTTYRSPSSKYTSPCSTLVQSSGFGKSQVLWEVTKQDASDMRVLSGTYIGHVLFPAVTINLNSFFFPCASSVTAEDIPRRLISAYNYAVWNWDTIRDDWSKLLLHKGMDGLVYEALHTYNVKQKHAAQRCTVDGVLVLEIDEGYSTNGKRECFWSHSSSCLPSTGACS